MGFVVFRQPALIYAASPLSMTVVPEWPVSTEMQFLCLATKAGRQTGNVCTPAAIAAGGPAQLSSDHIASQAESQPVWFRNVRLKMLP